MTLYKVTATIHHGDFRGVFAIEADGPRDLVTRLFVQSAYFPNYSTGQSDVHSKAATIWADLMATGMATWGWVDFVAKEIPTPEASGPRVYSVGVPLTITVDPNGRVTFDVDLSEADLDEGAENGGQSYDGDDILADQAVLDTLLDAIRHNIQITL